MNFEELEKVWEKQVIAGPSPAADHLVAEMRRDVATAQRRVRGGIIVVALAFAVSWLIAVGGHLAGIKLFTVVSIVAQLTFTALFVLFLIRARHTARVIQSETIAMGQNLRESTAATVRTIDVQVANAKIALMAIPLVVGVVAWLSLALYLSGSSKGIAVTANIALTMVVGTVMGAAVAYRWRRHLDPRRAELRSLLRELDSNAR